VNDDCLEPYRSILGVSKNASEKEIKIAYRRLASVHHPDKGGEASMFRDIQEAYDMLTACVSISVVSPPVNKTQKPIIYNIYVTLDEVCNGAVVSTKLGDIKIPLGIRTNTKITVRAGAIINVIVKEHERFVRELDDLYVMVKMTSIDAITGADLSIKHPSGGILKASVPALTKQSTKLRLQGQGMPNPVTLKNGDLYLVVQFDTPDLTSDQLSAILAISGRKTLII